MVFKVPIVFTKKNERLISVREALNEFKRTDRRI